MAYSKHDTGLSFVKCQCIGLSFRLSGETGGRVVRLTTSRWCRGEGSLNLPCADKNKPK